MNLLRKAILSARFIGIANALRSVRYALRRDRLNADLVHTARGGVQRVPGRLVSAVPASSGALFRFEAASLAVRFLLPDLLFFGWDGAEMKPSWAVCVEEPPAAAVTFAEHGSDGFSIRSDRVEVRAARDGGISLLTASGYLMRKEQPPEWSGTEWTSRCGLAPDAVICGLGERAARLDRRPGFYRFWNRDAGGSYSPGADPLYLCMPVYICLQREGSYFVFYDNQFDASATFTDQAVMRFSGGPARGYCAVGTPAALLDRLSWLTGRPPLPPRWALGYMQSQWGWASQKEMTRIWTGFRARDLPISALVMDIDHQRGRRTFTLDETRYPDLHSFSSELAAADTHLVAIVDPGVKRERGYDVFDSGSAAGVFLKSKDGKPVTGIVWPGVSVYPDFTAAGARDWWGRLYARHLACGVDGFWHDMNEPAAFAAWGDLTLPLGTPHDMDGAGGDHRAAHNIYGHLMNLAGYEGLRRLRPDRRPFLLSRSGWVGMQRTAWTWTGDTETSWEMLAQTIPTVLGLGLSGQPFAGPDIGGFSGSPSPELFVRWLQLGSFMPFFRTHSAFFLPRREPWEFGDEILGIARATLKLRYRLLAFWYTLAWHAHETGAPLLRPLFWADPADAELWRVDDAFMAGDSLLVAPLLAEGARERTVRLPRGTWFDFDTGSLIPGGGMVSLNAPLSRIPILVRDGSVIPDVSDRALTLHLYPPAVDSSRTSMLYSDAGDGYGAGRVDRFFFAGKTEEIELTWTNEGGFPWPYDSIFLHLHGWQADRVTIDGTATVLEDGKIRVPAFARLSIPR
jgi:alpha-glucosidase